MSTGDGFDFCRRDVFTIKLFPIMVTVYDIVHCNASQGQEPLGGWW